jgi:hypothetical protein|tara:strand:- start:5 stop:304 length:300 start_codon:yes stop_codon:yes gene_type:complete
MRAHDFLTERSIKVEIPINITIPQDGSDPKVSVADKSNDDDSEAQKVMVSPLQQEIEMAKASQGKESPVIDELTDDDEEIGEEVKETTSKLETLLKELV